MLVPGITANSEAISPRLAYGAEQPEVAVGGDCDEDVLEEAPLRLLPALIKLLYEQRGSRIRDVQHPY